MRLWKKALSLVLVSAMAFSMCACGGKKDEGSKKTDTFKIGGIGPTTGDAAIYGKAVQNGIQLAVDEQISGQLSAIWSRRHQRQKD